MSLSVTSGIVVAASGAGSRAEFTNAIPVNIFGLASGVNLSGGVLAGVGYFSGSDGGVSLNVNISGGTLITNVITSGGNVVTLPGINSGTQVLLSGGATALSGGERFIAGYTYKHISTAAITNVQSGASILHGVVVNSWAVSGQVLVQDSLSGITGGANIATINQLNSSTTIPSQTLIYDVYCLSGIVVSTSGTNDVTIVYKNPA